MRINFNCYKALDVPNFSPFDKVKEEYRKLTLVNHPDRGGNEETMKLINAAYDVLKKQKEKYDLWLRRILRPPEIQSFTVVFKAWPQNYASNWCNSTSGSTDSTTGHY